MQPVHGHLHLHMTMKNFRLFAAFASTAALAAAIVACSADTSQNENIGTQQEGICLNYPCTSTTKTGIVATSSGVYYDDPGYSFTCKGKVSGTSYYYEVQPNGKCAIVDPYGCKDSGTSNIVTTTTSDGGCWGSTIISYYLCPANHPSLSCSPYTGVCSCV